MASADLVIRIITDTSRMKGLDEASGRFGRVGDGLRKAAVPAGIALGAIVAFGKGAVEAASRSQQAMGAVDSVFGRNAAQVKKWASESATAVGLSKASYAELATVMGAQLKNMGLPMGQVAGQTNELIKLGADLAATYGGTTQEAVEALGSAFRGETDPIERYGVSVKQADIAAQMAADGTDKLTGSAGKQAQAMATLALINKQTADAQGAFGREADTAAHAAQVSAAQYEDMKASLGQALLPVVTKVTAALGKLANFMLKHKTGTQVAIGAVAGLAAAILVLNVAMGVYTAITTLAAAVTWATLWPILLVVAAVAALVVVFVLLYKKSTTFRKAVQFVWAAMKRGAKILGAFLKKLFTGLWRGISQGAVAMYRAVKGAWDRVKSASKAVVSAITGFWRNLLGRLRAIFASIRSAAGNAWSWIVDRARGALDHIKGAFDNMRDRVAAVFARVREAISSVVAKAGDLVGRLRDIQVPGFLVSTFNAIRGAIQDVINMVNNLISALRNIPTPHINWPSPPKWLDKVMPGMAPAPPVPGVARFGAPRVPMVGTRASAGSGAVNITVTGAIDPEATARQIQRILSGHQRRVAGLRPA